MFVHEAMSCANLVGRGFDAGRGFVREERGIEEERALLCRSYYAYYAICTYKCT
jgi:hypothetical protein